MLAVAMDGEAKIPRKRLIANAVAAPPVEWNISLEERAILAKYMADRRDQMLALS